MNTTDWMADANCRQHPPELFIPERITQKITDQAKTICNTCPVLEQCRTYAQRLHAIAELDGIFAGMTKRERRLEWGTPALTPVERPRKHGTLYSYRQLKCRCNQCRTAHTETIRRQRQTRRNAPRHISDEVA